MSPRLRLALGVALCLAVAVLAMAWAAAMMASMYAFRSPLAAAPPAPGERIGPPLTRRLAIVLIDALRDDTSRKMDVMPYLNGLRRQGASATMHSRAPSFSQTGNTVLFTGGWQELSDAPLLNLEGDQRRAWSQDSLFSAAHRAGLKTAVAADLSLRGQIPQETVDVHFYTQMDGAPGDAEVIGPALVMLRDPSYALVLIHLDQVDYAGHHLGGAASQAWTEAAHRTDEDLRQIGNELDFSQDTLLVVSDHGQLDQGGHGGPEAIVLLEPFVIAGKGIKPGKYGDVSMVDIAPTGAALLGINVPASSQGQVLTDVLALNPEAATAIARAQSAQQARLAAAYAAAVGQPLPSAQAALTVSESQAAIHSAQAARLARERLPRLIIAILISVIPGIFLFRHGGNTLGWLFAGALIYLVAFNVMFLLLLRQSYSLSTVDTAQGLLGTAALANLVAFGLSWLIVSLRLGVLGDAPLKAAERTVALTLVTLYSLIVTMLVNYVVNGITIIWAVPELHTMFAGFFAMLASLFVSIFGLLLAGLGALIALLRRCSQAHLVTTTDQELT